MFVLVSLILWTQQGSACDARRDPFCADLEEARRIERRWIELDTVLASPRSGREPCVAGATDRARAARSAASLKSAAYRRYYELWIKLTDDSLRGFAAGLMRDADSRHAVEQLLAAAETDYADLQRRSSALPDNEFSEFSRRSLDELMRQGQARISNLQVALTRWDADRKSNEAASGDVRTVRKTMQEALHAVIAESLLWDSYYDGIAILHTLKCGDSQ